LAGELWNPSEEINLPQWYSLNNTITEGKPFCREVLNRRLGFNSGNSSTVVCNSLL
jgi:hypothetical protein